MPKLPADGELWRCNPQGGLLNSSIQASIRNILFFCSVSVIPFVIPRNLSLNVRI